MLMVGNQALHIQNLEVPEFSPGPSAYQVLIGRDIICQGVLTVDFSGRFTFSVCLVDSRGKPNADPAASRVVASG